MTKIKICGITRPDDAHAACLAGADALGFNFSPASPRLITPDRAKDIIEKLPPFITPVGVFVEQSPQEIDDICRYCGVLVAQLHSDTYMAEEALLVTSAKIIRVFRPGPEFSIEEVRAFAQKTGCNGFLFDAYNPAMAGGTGETIESSTAVELFEQTRELGWALLAGGLRPDNVGNAIRLVRPWGVDTASGVESTPGLKEREKMIAFVDAVREADRSVRSCF